MIDGPQSFPTTSFTNLVGCPLPVQQAGMGAVSTPALAAAVAREGGLGMIGAAGLAPDEVARQVEAAMTAAGPGARVGANFLMPFLDLAAFEAAAATAVVVECFYGEPDAALVARGHDAGALVAWQVGSVDEAKEAVAGGCDFIVVQGTEAGGHVRGKTPLLPLLDAVRPNTDLPLVAAGGIGSGRAAAAAFEVGADAIRVGTLLLATPEADVHPAYADALVRAGGEDTVITEAFSMAWPDAPHRVLRSCVEASDEEPATRSPFPPTRAFAGAPESAALYAGLSVSDVHRVEPAAAVIRRLVAETSDALASMDHRAS